MSFLRLHDSIAYFVALLGLFSLTLGDDLSSASVLFWAATYVVSWWIPRSWPHDERWSRAWTWGVLVFLGLQVARGALGAPVVPLALEFIAGLMLSRLANRKSAQAYREIGALAILELIGATVLTSELTYAFVFLTFLIVLPWILVLSHLRTEIEKQMREKVSEEQVQRLLAARSLVGLRFLFFSTALSIPLFAMTGLLFMMFPRVGFGFLAFGTTSSERVAGFGRNVTLGDFGRIRDNPSVVLRVTPPNLPASPPLEVALRLRGTSFDYYDGRQWTRSPSDERHRIRRQGQWYAVPHEMPDPERHQPWSFVMEPLDEPVLFLPPNTVGLELPPRVEMGAELGRSIRWNAGLDIRYVDGNGNAERYRAWTGQPSASEVAPLSSEDRSRYLQIPEGHGRVRTLSRRLTSGARDDRERLQRLLEFLRDGEFAYSLDTPYVGQELPLDVFLFDAKRGHCEYFSTALVILLRAQGIPARNVTGFLGGRWNAYGGYYSVAQGDAHSWVEAWLPNEGWVSLEPTPGSRNEIHASVGVLGFVTDFMDALRIRWNRDIVSFDLHTQRSVASRLRQLVQNLWTDSEGQARGVSRSESDGQDTSTHWTWASVALVLLALVLWGFWRWRRRTHDSDVPLDAQEAIALYRVVERVLGRMGHPRPLGVTPQEHAALLQKTQVLGAGLIAEITERYVLARYGRVPISSDERIAYETALRRIGK